MIKNISVDEALEFPAGVLVDVRSEGEFADGTIPGAVNICLLNNEERSRVGIHYKQIGPDQAKRLGLELVSPRLAGMVQAYDHLVGPEKQDKKVVLFCWRGGMRSQYVAQVLDMMGFDVYRIEGGYKAYRRNVNSYLEGDLSHRAVVIHGLTGVGKTIILKKLAEKGFPVLDLEGLAVHRGSVYGKVGLPPSPSQKDFEALIFRDLKKAEAKGVFLVECESRRLGRLLVPTSVIRSMKRGYKILIYAPLEVRVRRSLDEYTSGFEHKENINQLLKATGSLVRYLGHKKVDELSRLIAGGEMDRAVEFLLVEYYDPLYRYPGRPSPDYDLSVDSTDIDQAVEKICRFVAGLPEYNVPVNGGVPNGNRECPEGCQGIQRDIPGSRRGKDQDPPEVSGGAGG